MHIAEASPTRIEEFCARVEAETRELTSLEAAAQALARRLHLAFDESVALARVFVTVPYGALPEENRRFVARRAAPSEGLVDTTPVLTLLGTHGDQAHWNDRHQSRGHVGIPLISSRFVGEIPMVSRLLKELGVPIAWIDSHDAVAIQKTLGDGVQLFFVEDAGSAVDDRKRRVIVAEDFVTDYKIETVFGIGGAYADGSILVVVVFSHDRFSREQAEQFLPLVTLFKEGTEALEAQGRIFA